MKYTKIMIVLLVFLISSVQEVHAQRRVQRRRVNNIEMVQRWAVSTAWLIQNAPFREFASFQLDRVWYAQGIDTWDMGDAATGLAVGFSYDLTFQKGLMFRIQGYLESTGWISGILDIGTGIRIPMTKTSFFSIEVYFSINQTGSTLYRIGKPEDSLPESINLYMGLFGFKSRVAFEVTVSKKYFLTPYLSYAVYPWKASNLENPVYLNGFNKGSLIDSIQIGLEFGSRF